MIRTIALALVSMAGPGVTFATAQQAEPESPFGPNVLIVEPGDSSVQKQIDAIFEKQQKVEFTTDRHAILLKPGTHDLDIRVGYYTHVMGLGREPGDVHVRGAVRALQVPEWDNVLINFWRAVENYAVTPTGPRMDVWGVSQATAMRRVHVRGNLFLAEGGASSGGFIADSVVDGTVNSMSQQQYILRNTDIGGWESGLWNMVFVGVPNAPEESWPDRPFTTVDQTPLVREKPFLTWNEDDGYAVAVPALRRESAGASWAGEGGTELKQLIPLSDFHVADPERDDAASINAALAEGKHLLITPGIYELSEPLHIRNADTVVYTMGYASLVPTNGTAAVLVDDVPGVTLAGLFVDAGEEFSDVLIQIGGDDAGPGDPENPIAMFDIFTRSGGWIVGQCETFLEINSSHVIGDNFWLWRADHGKGAEWDENLTAHGLIVNGDNVTVHGLFNEHNQHYQTIWNGEDGRVFMYQSEMPYDPPSQRGWGNDGFGFASYKVADHVERHEAIGVGIYCVFIDAPIVAHTAIEAPDKPGVNFHNVIIVRLGGQPGGIRHAINDKGGPVISDDKFMTSRHTDE